MLNMAQLSNGNPQKVLTKAVQLGVHNDCLVADIDGACESCIETLHQVYDLYYGHILTVEGRLEAILDDLHAEREIL